jgi:hypothetical protein
MLGFKDLKFNTHPSGDGIQSYTEFDNGYGASVVKSDFTIGGKIGLYEIAIFKDGNITYDTPITDNVIGNLDEDNVTKYLYEIQML